MGVYCFKSNVCKILPSGTKTSAQLDNLSVPLPIHNRLWSATQNFPHTSDHRPPPRLQVHDRRPTCTSTLVSYGCKQRTRCKHVSPDLTSLILGDKEVGWRLLVCCHGARGVVESCSWRVRIVAADSLIPMVKAFNSI